MNLLYNLRQLQKHSIKINISVLSSYIVLGWRTTEIPISNFFERRVESYASLIRASR